MAPATATTDEEAETFRANATARARRRSRRDEGAAGSTGSSGPVTEDAPGRTPGGVTPSLLRRATTSATVVSVAAPTTTPSATLAYRPRPGVIGATSLAMAIGTTKLPTPIERLAMVS